MGDKQYGVSHLEQHLAEEKTQRRIFLRNEFLKQRTNPFQHATGEGGAVFDSALMRYQALQVSGTDFFKPMGRNLLRGIFGLVVPLFGLGYIVQTTRNKQEMAYRSGEVAYKDRIHKFA